MVFAGIPSDQLLHTRTAQMLLDWVHWKPWQKR